MTDRVFSEKRRDFLLASMKIILAAGLAPFGGGGCATTRQFSTEERDGELVVNIAAFPELSSIGGGIMVTAKEILDPIYLVRVNGDSFRALSSKCSHQGCTVRLLAGFFQCPCHGSTYSIEGEVVRGPANQPLPEYKITLRDGLVSIKIEPQL